MDVLDMKLFWQVEPSVHRVYDLIQRHQKKGKKDLWWIFEFKIMEHDDLMNLKTSIFCKFRYKNWDPFFLQLKASMRGERCHGRWYQGRILEEILRKGREFCQDSQVF